MHLQVVLLSFDNELLEAGILVIIRLAWRSFISAGSTGIIKAEVSNNGVIVARRRIK